MLNFIQNVCGLAKTAMDGLIDSGADSVAPDAGGVVRVLSSDSAPPRSNAGQRIRPTDELQFSSTAFDSGNDAARDGDQSRRESPSEVPSH
jgi:hypothetical protein